MRITLALLATFLLTGWGEYERVECIGDKERLPVYQLIIDFEKGGGQASGVMVADGYVLTAAHAVDGDPLTISVITPEGPRAASRIASDPVNDLSLLAVETTGMSPLAFYREAPEPGQVIWTAGFAGDAGITYKGPILAVTGGHLKMGAPVFPGMSGGAVIACEDGVPYLAGINSSFNYRITRRYTEMTEEKIKVFERVVNDGTSNAAGGMMALWFTEYAIEMHKKREQEQE